MGTHKDRALAMGRSIRTLRKRRNLTQKELAQLSGLSESSLRSYELGARYPKADGIARIAKALAVPLECFDTCNITTELELLHALFRAVIASDRRGRGKKRPVICLETSEHFDSVNAVEKSLGCDGRRLWKALNKGYSIHGLHYYYADEPKPDDLLFEHKRGGYKRSKPIVCLETGELFESADDAAISIGCKAAYITSAIREGFPVKGFHFDVRGIEAGKREACRKEE